MRKYETRVSAPAFTLIELLICVAIMMILASLLLPVLTSVKTRARRVICLNNVRSIAIAQVMYAGDNNKRYLQIGLDGADAFDGAASLLYYWEASAADTLKDEYAGGDWKAFGCPQWYRKPMTESRWTTGNRGLPGIYRGTTYVMTTTPRTNPDSYLGESTGDLDKDGTPDNLRPVKLAKSAHLMVVGDHIMQTTPGYWNFSGGPPHAYAGMPRGGSFAYGDGHALWANFNELTQAYSYMGSINDGERDYFWTNAE